MVERLRAVRVERIVFIVTGEFFSEAAEVVVVVD
jgi:hypothetical protein